MGYEAQVSLREGLYNFLSIQLWRLQPDHPISIRSAAQTRLPALRLPNRYSDDVHYGIASYHEIFQHRSLSIVSSWRKEVNPSLWEINLRPYPFVRYFFDQGVGSPCFNYVEPVIVSTASTFEAFVMGDPNNIPHLIILTRPENPNRSLFLLQHCYTDCNLVIQGNMRDRFIL